jgi:hypothetical protein
VGDGRLPPTVLYLSRHFPETAALLFPREILGWPSPDGRFAIRKTFSDELNLGASKVVRAELVEKKTGQVLYDLTADDIGTGWQREGTVLWSPDSKRFAYLAIDLTMSPGNLFSIPNPKAQKKVTSIYQLTGETWGRIDLPSDKVPGREKDTELQGAVLGHEFTEPVRWQKPGVLVLTRHEYYEKIKPLVEGGQTFNTIGTLSRWYQITATITPEGQATLVWKLRTER